MNSAQMNLIGELIDANAGNVHIQVDPWDPDNPLRINNWILTEGEARTLIERCELVAGSLRDQWETIDKLCRTSKAA